ncbi:chromosome partition protein Smc [Aeromonas caviae]|uniref:AAA family ATPase n=1 Tax=Aeromonas hydrophila TaxID=644 RepID=UPI000464BAB7|nr:AAA family ATPase [Aeromonas hydrophila]GKQ60675.1 chromosome partition protein Smc [Aeromonas caviae]MDE8811095.1 AAA family ATPase [Aeromonas hydrophila]BDC83429.1 chromosome partition protein Smc [Aeromonas hydrophila]HAT2489171.1 AAA family ATPase [Aeromonas hydrophila]HAT2493727.1 AAA family ATPase [Aeromonas hydrophila]
MRLKLIKLAGFKSFVEPTRIELNADMTAVVGPNGCGKSNVIDAVRWVLGESSARHLRGENMTDVIFNGSVNRSAHGRASVELVFDNPHNRVPGEFGRFTEISVRREVLRDGSNHYQINGQKCRRKDVTDLFLGTGLGPRSYAIIEQGTVSRLVESRPADLKLFMEEAAGVSRYKERRRETEQRIRHTQENLERLGDIRGELGSRLEHLKAQAETAERYKQLKSRSRAARAELIGSELWALETRLGEAKTELAQTEQALAALDAKRTEGEGRHVTLSVARQEAQAEQASRQQQIFLGGQAIARLEQQQLHQSELGRDWQARRQALGERIEGLKAQLAGQLEQLSESTLQGEVASARLEQCEQLLTDQQSVRAAATERLERERQRQQQWQQQLGQLQGRLNQTHAEVNGLQELQAKTRLARLKLEDEQAGPLGGEGENLQPALDALATELALSRARHEESEAAWQAAVARREALKTEQGHQQGLLRELEARLATLDQILGEQMAGATLADRLQVPPKWARGLDKVLGRWLTATPADECNLTQSGLWIGPAQPAVAGTLAAQLGGEHIPSFLNAIWLVESREAALARQPSLAAGESLLTPAGDWFGPNWGDLGEGMALGTLALLGERERLHTEQSAGREALRRLDEQLAAADATRAQLHGAHELAQRTLREQEQQWQQLREAWSLREGQRQERLQRLGQLGEELARLAQEQAEEAERLASAGERLEQGEAALGELQEQGEVLAEALLLAQEQASGAERALEEARLRREQQQAACQRLQLEQQNLRQLIALREQELARLGLELAELKEPGAAPGQDLSPLLAEQRNLEAQQLACHQRLAELERQLTELEQARSADHKQLVQIQEKLATLRLERERNLTRRQGLHEQFEELGVRLVDLDQAVLIAADRGKLRQEIQTLEAQVEALGAINLAALEEYEEAKTRSSYLENQCQDLEQALETLSQAIKRIDKETQIRFRDTFDKVNEDLKSLFPKVFGGGSAWLELTSDDLLEAGVSIMARPPGKKNATIALLSGGEKALTALALVFAIFRLNPAPFCLLDEVDAPLDEVNVGRFCSLVKEMSSTVQFVYISHNKVSMEMAEQLVGVTMQEPGVSRIVSVDIGEAVALAEQN